MKFKNPLIVVTDLERSRKFYKETLGLRVVADFGANITLTGGLALQTEETWRQFIDAADDGAVQYGGNDAEIYFEEDDFDAFAAHLAALDNIDYVCPVKEHAWGQRVVRFYDPDKHIIEVGENMSALCRRFAAEGMTPAAIAERMDIDVKYVNAYLRGK